MATVNYSIHIGDEHFQVSVEQRNTSGWTSLGEWDTNSADVAIAVFDSDVKQHYKTDGYFESSIGVDAVRMRCVANCG